MLGVLLRLVQRTTLRPIPAGLCPGACCPSKWDWPQKTTTLDFKLQKQCLRCHNESLPYLKPHSFFPPGFSTWISLAQELKVQGSPRAQQIPCPSCRAFCAKPRCPGRCAFLKNLLIFLLRNPISACAYPCRPRDRCQPGQLREGGGLALQTIIPQAAASQLAKKRLR